MDIADEAGAMGGSGDFNQYFQRNVSQMSLAPSGSTKALGNAVEDGDGSSLRSMERNNSQVLAAPGRASLSTAAHRAVIIKMVILLSRCTRSSQHGQC